MKPAAILRLGAQTFRFTKREVEFMRNDDQCPRHDCIRVKYVNLRQRGNRLTERQSVK